MRLAVRSRSIAIVSLILAGFALGSSPASAQSTAEAAADAGSCDALVDATPGLRGICVAYCERLDCSNPDSPECSVLRSSYDRRRRTGDPDLPCLPICPCFALSDLLDHPVELDACEIGASGGQAWAGVWDHATALQGCGTFSSTEFGDFAQCRFQNTVVEPPDTRFARISLEEAAVCRAIVAEFVAARGLDCL